MAVKHQLVCSRCHEAYTPDAVRWRCDCGGPLDLVHRQRFEHRRIGSRGPTLWRYRESLPIDPDATPVHLGEGYTPLLQGRVGGYPVWLKQDHLFPSGSYKDRGASILISHAAALGVQRVVEDSSGNAGAAIAAYCARAGISCEIYVPEHTSPDKLVQIRGYGALLHRVPGGREATALAAQQAAETTFYASHVWNPYFLHGVKTFAFELWEQMGRRAPDTLVLPVGNGTLLLGAAIGFEELRAAKQIERLPRLVGVQTEACAPLATAFAQGQPAPTETTSLPTLAEGIAIAAPARGEQILAAVRAGGGQFVTVSEQEIALATQAWWRHGFALEPTAAATLAGLARYLASGVHNREIVVSTITGHGLKAAATLSDLFSEGEA
jgi:threonine synthase